MSPAPGTARPLPRPAIRKHPSLATFDDAEIDAALMPLSAPPPGQEQKPSAEPGAAESWRPPIEPGSLESLDDLDAVEMPGGPDYDDSLPETRQSSELPDAEAGRVTPDSAALSIKNRSASSVTVEPPEYGRWEEEPTSMQPIPTMSASRDATVEYSSVSFDEIEVAPDDSDPDSIITDVADLGDGSPPARRDASTERPAAAHLGGHRLIDAWVARAEWFEEEAQATDDNGARARLLLAASELWAMAGNTSRARDSAKRAAQATPSLSLAARQARAIAGLEGDFKAVAVALDAESRSATTDAARAHAAYVAAEVYRLALGDPQSAERRLDLVVRTSPNDPRPYAMRIATELGGTAAGPKMRWPESPELDPLARAAAELSRLRGDTKAEVGTRSPAVAFEDARRALARGDREAAGAAIRELSSVPNVGNGALFLSAALLAPSAETRPRAIEALVELGQREPSASIRRALAARSLEQGDAEAMSRALAESDGEGDAASPAFAPADRLALGALAGGDAESLGRTMRELADDETLRPLTAAIASASSASEGFSVGDPARRAFLALGRALATAPGTDALKDPVHALRAAAPNAALGRILALELDVAAGATSAVAAELTRLAPADQQAHGKLAAALLEEAAGHSDVARRHYASALGAPAVAEAAVRALLRPEEGRAADLLSTLSSALGDETTARQALLLFEAAMLTDPEDTAAVEELLGRSYDACPELPFAARRGGDLARAKGDAPKLLEWIGKERKAATEPLGRALVSVREALLIADEDAAGAAARVADALEVRPDDAALHELSERLDPTARASRGRFRERLAEQAELPRTKSWLLYEATMEYARASAMEDAARVAAALGRTEGGSALAQVVAERLAPNSSEPPAEGLMSLRELEQELLVSDRDEELEALSSELVDLPDRGEAGAHARLAARLRVKKDTWETTRDLVERAARLTPRSLWILRQASAHARVAGDDERLFESDRELLSRVERPLDAATLSLRAAESAARLGKTDEAIALLGRTIEVTPDHLVARDLRARLAEQNDAAGAAADLEAMARAAHLPAHQWSAWYRAGVLFIDKAADAERGLAALEQAATIDVAREDVFDRLQLLYVQRGDRAKLASLLEQRLEKTDDPAERISLEVTRGKALADVGDRDAARRALSAALEASPDHADALEAFAGLAAADGDFQSAEQSFIRLARLATDPEKQADIYGRLAKLYQVDIPNPTRAEICYREILKRRPNDPVAIESLVRMYVGLGDAVKALELQNGLVERAANTDEKRDRTLALSLVYEEAAKDKKSAFTVLEKARKAWPHDNRVLRAVAEHHGRHGEVAAANVLIDRAGAEARRALSHGRFDLAFFGILETAAALRGNADAERVIAATVAALEGKDEGEIQGAGAAASAVQLDDLLAPDLLSPAFRALLRKLPGVLDAAYPVDLKSLRATPLPESAAELAQEMRVVAESVGVRSLELLVSPALGPVFVPVSGSPAKLVMGQPLIETEDDAARYFSFFRALKMIESEGAAFTRIPPIELLPATSALLVLLAPSFQPQGVDAGKLADAKRRIQAALPARLHDDLPTLALEVGGTLGNRASQLGQAVSQWASRAALLAVGRPSIALRGIALALGQPEGPPADFGERLKWVQRHPETRDLAVFSVSDAYADARKRVGLG
jgi:tetratricopeptide (TPR) repeat protein